MLQDGKNYFLQEAVKLYRPLKNIPFFFLNKVNIKNEFDKVFVLLKKSIEINKINNNFNKNINILFIMEGIMKKIPYYYYEEYIKYLYQEYIILSSKVDIKYYDYALLINDKYKQ
jgi:hypothetical protein